MGVTLCQGEGIPPIVMSISPSVVGRLRKKRLTKWIVTGTVGPPGYALYLLLV